MALSALVEDLHSRGLDKDVSVVVWGEFGRTPQINKHAGRDHWPPVNFALLAGGGMRTGQVIGSTDKHRGLRQGPARHVPERLRHALPQPRHRPGHEGLRPRRPAHVPARRTGTDGGGGLSRLASGKTALSLVFGKPSRLFDAAERPGPGDGRERMHGRDRRDRQVHVPLARGGFARRI